MKKKSILLGALLTAGIVITHAQTQEESDQIIKETNVSALGKISKESAEQFARDQKEVMEFARKKNIPVIIQNRDGSTQKLMKIEDGNPIYYSTNNVDAAKSVRANHLHSGGSLGLNLAGENILVGIWDSGKVRPTHKEFGSRVTVGDNTTSLSDHSTHVAGIIAAAGTESKAKGMAPKVLIKSYDFDSDISEMSTAAAAGLLISNHSYGYTGENLADWYFGAYIKKSADMDNILFNAPYYVICNSAGNDGNKGYNDTPFGGTTGVFDNLTDSSTAKNTIVVANAKDAVIDANGNLTSVSINASSSQGPTDDLRIKPDITGNGTSLYSCLSDSDTAYGNKTGTSMSTPNVAGTLVLVNEHFKNQTGSFMPGAALKGLALHTADDAGDTGPDANFGWGLLNAKRMAETINNRNTTALITDKKLTAGAKETVTINSDGINPVTASISWYDLPGTIQTSNDLNSTTKRLVNDLDLRIVSENGQTTYFPWALTSRSTNAKQDNNSDNFERVNAGVIPAGKYSVVINHKGTLTGGSQNYTLIVTGRAIAPVILKTKKSEISEETGGQTAVLKIYPNPAQNEINVRMSVKDKKASIRIFDGSGKQVLNQIAVNGENKIDISNTVAGTYIITVSDGSDTQSEKFIKQ